MPNVSTTETPPAINMPPRPGNKALQPQGTSSKKASNEISINISVMVLHIDSLTKSDSKESDNDSCADSLSKLIASAWKTLFNSTPPAGKDNITIASGRSKRWVPIQKTGDKDVTTATGSLRKGATFVAGKKFREQEAPQQKRPRPRGKGRWQN
jgi:hypothetical protein